MQESLFQRERRHVRTAAAFRVSQRFINEENLHAFGTEVPMYRLQTGDVSDERWSGQTSENEDGVFALHAAERKLLTVLIVDGYVGHLLTDLQT
jgi:hypothetical protein